MPCLSVLVLRFLLGGSLVILGASAIAGLRGAIDHGMGLSLPSFQGDDETVAAGSESEYVCPQVEGT